MFTQVQLAQATEAITFFGEFSTLLVVLIIFAFGAVVMGVLQFNTHMTAQRASKQLEQSTQGMFTQQTINL